MSTDIAAGAGIARPDKATAAAHVVAATAQACSVLARITDGDATAVGTWSARTLAVHLEGGLRVYTQLLTGAGSPIKTLADIPAFTEQALRDEPETDLRVLATRIDAAVAEFAAAALAIEGDPTVPWHFDLPMPVSCLLGIFVGESVVHGWDLARTAGVRWRIPAQWGHTALRGVVPAMPILLDGDAAAGVRSTYDIRMRGEGAPRIVMKIADGELTVHQPGSAGRVDCYLSGDPLSLLLVLYGRKGPVGPALSGKALAWGRKPWAGFTMTKYFHQV